MPATERLDKFISANTPLTRSLARRAIHAGEVTVNGAVVRDGASKINTRDVVHYQGTPLHAATARYVMLHKPLGYVCANEDGHYPTVIDLLKEPWRFSLHVAGRLDVDTTGLVLLTDDGEWSHRVTAPRHKQPKRYLVTTADPLQSAWGEVFSQGLILHGEEKPTLPAQLEIIDTHTAYLTLHEGRYHQVKRMLAAVGTHVTALHRVSIGKVLLDQALAPGAYRLLTDTEVESLRGVSYA